MVVCKTVSCVIMTLQEKKAQKNIVEIEENAGLPAFSSFSTMFSTLSKTALSIRTSFSLQSAICFQVGPA